MLKAIIFDMDGVLVDSMSYHAQAVKNIFDRIGVKMDKKDIFEREGERTADIITFLLEKETGNISAYDVPDIVERYIQEFNRIAELQVFEEVRQCLGSIRSRFRLSVVSGSDKPIVYDIIGKEFPEIFEVIVTGDDVKRGKPDPEPYLQAVGMLGIDKDECIVVENAPMGVESARKAGLYCIAVPTYLDPEKLKSADLVLKDYRELADYLFQLGPHSTGCPQVPKS
ncbi:HAD family hydrolase [Methanolobus halotolerans]|uniref:HAD family phosphatase n=1 Tax=Methanolobus halotolerans TaxID=2052935 RepID=A0A4E0PXM5_9EURY|nr:HAD family phosphatase [Methanolobus halotolerans]TGC09473.1 HAD family phosphatase [Methanolobus halotolerans]